MGGPAMRAAYLTAPAGDLRAVPGEAGPPIIGHTLHFMHDPLGWSRYFYDRYGPVAWTNTFGIRLVSAAGPDAVERVLVNRDKAFSNGRGWEYFIGPFFRRGIMLLDFEEHLHHRRIMQQAFTRERLASYLDTMNPAIAAGIVSFGSTAAGAPLRAHRAFKKLTLDLATRTFTGGELGPRAERVNRAFIDAVRAGTAYVRFPVPGLRWSRGLRGRRLLEELLRAQLPAKRAHASAADLFAALCQARSEDGHRFGDDDVINHMIFLLMAAHDTTTMTLTTMAYYLAKHPAWQDRARQESAALGTEAVALDNLDRLVSLDLVMKECLRLVTPLQAMARKTVRDTEILGYFVPADTFVTVSAHFIHHMPEYWPDPERFDPERFAEHRREDRVHNYAWLPFGGGVHKCIGLRFAALQVKAVLHQLLLAHRWTVPVEYEMPLDYTSMPTPSDGLPIRLQRL
ncbi:MAG TPA: cytochrome P450 [Pseudonocardiaceae bacterium]|jgi:cytochrome P450